MAQPAALHPSGNHGNSSDAAHWQQELKRHRAGLGTVSLQRHLLAAVRPALRPQGAVVSSLQPVQVLSCDRKRCDEDEPPDWLNVRRLVSISFSKIQNETFIFYQILSLTSRAEENWTFILLYSNT